MALPSDIFAAIKDCSIGFFLKCLFTVAFGLHCCANFSLAVASRGSSVAVVRGLLVTVASVAEHRLSVALASVVATRWAQQSQCLGSRAQAQQLLHSMWDLTGSGIIPVSPALAGGLFTTEPPGKPWGLFFFNHIFQFLLYSLNENVKIIHYLLIPQSKCKGFSFVSRLGYDVDLV